MVYRVKPYEGTDELKFGMTKTEVRKMMGTKPKVFKRYLSKSESDMYNEFFVYYTESYICEAIEFFNPAEVIFKNKLLFKMTYKELVLFFQSIDINTKIDNAGLTSFKYGVGLYAPSGKEEPDEFPKTVIIFKENYYGQKLE